MAKKFLYHVLLEMGLMFFFVHGVYAYDNVITIKVFNDTNMDGIRQSTEKWLEGVVIQFDHTGEDGYFKDYNDPLRPENDDSHYTKVTDKNGTVVKDVRRGNLYVSIDKKQFEYTPEETTHLMRVNYNGKIDEWIVGVIPKAIEKPVSTTKDSTKQEVTKKTEETSKKEQETTALKEEVTTPTEKEQLNSAAPQQCSIFEYRSCTTGNKNGFLDYANDLACEGIIKRKSNCDEYHCERDISKVEVVGIGLKMARIELPQNYVCQGKFSDVSSSLPSWMCRAAELGLQHGIAVEPGSDKKFYPEKQLDRLGSYAHLMRSVCMKILKTDEITTPFDKNLGYTDWEQRVIRTAQKYGLTTRTDENFKPNRPIYRQELFVVASKLLDWAQETGGCYQENMCK